MEKTRFGTLFLRALRRSGDWRLIVYFILLIVLLYAPVLGLARILPRCFPGVSGRWFGIGLYLVWSFLYSVLAVAGICGSMEDKTTMRRSFMAGLARWKSAWLLLPWSWLLAVLFMIPNIAPGSDVNFALFTLVLLPGLMAACLWMSFLGAAIAAAPPESGIKTLHRAAFRAFRNGWGRLSLAMLFAWLSAALGIAADRPLTGQLCKILTKALGRTVLPGDLYIPWIPLVVTAWISGFFCAFLARLGAETRPETTADATATAGKDETI